jgi:3-carboxy-cis,cis-muconate cycloisomerase
MQGLQADPQRMRANLDLSGGLMMAEALTLAWPSRSGEQKRAGLWKPPAIARTAGGSLQQAAHDNPRISAAMSPEAIDRALDPGAYLGSADALIDRALKSAKGAFNALRSSRSWRFVLRLNAGWY